MKSLSKYRLNLYYQFNPTVSILQIHFCIRWSFLGFFLHNALTMYPSPRIGASPILCHDSHGFFGKQYSATA